VRIDWDGPGIASMEAQVSAQLLPRLAEEVEAVAYSLAPVRYRHTPVPKWAKHGYVGMPGHLKASVGTEFGTDEIGDYADVGSLGYGRFMEGRDRRPARQIREVIPFLPSALIWTVDGREFWSY